MTDELKIRTDGTDAAFAPKQKWSKGDSIYVRLARAQEDVRALTQDSLIETRTFKYKGVSAAQIVTVAKSALLSNGIIFIPHPDPDRVRVEGHLVAIWVSGEFAAIDGDDTIDSGAWGSGIDSGDKALAKAYTNAQKLILAKVLGMSTLEEEEGRSVDDAKPDAKGKHAKLVLAPEGSISKADEIIMALNELRKPLSPDDKDAFIEKWGAAIDTLLQPDADRVREAYKARAKK